MGGWRYAWRTEIGDELFTEICTLAEATVVGDPVPKLTQWRAALAAADPSQLPAPTLRIDWPAQWNRDVVAHVRQRLTPAAAVSLACLAQEAIATNWHDEYTLDWATRSQLRWLSETTGHPTLAEAHDLLSDLLPGSPGELRPFFVEDPDVAPPTATQLILRELISTPAGLGNRSEQELFEFASPRLNELATIAATLGRPNEVDRGGAYRLIAQVLMSLSPAEREQQADTLAAPLMAHALSPTAAGRRAAQDAAELLSGTDNRVLAAIIDRQLDRRIQAADWAARSQVPGAVAALSRAFAKEKTDAGMVAQLDALERLGEPLTSYLSADGLGTRDRGAEETCASGHRLVRPLLARHRRPGPTLARWLPRTRRNPAVPDRPGGEGQDLHPQCHAATRGRQVGANRSAGVGRARACHLVGP